MFYHNVANINTIAEVMQSFGYQFCYMTCNGVDYRT